AIDSRRSPTAIASARTCSSSTTSTRTVSFVRFRGDKEKAAAGASPHTPAAAFISGCAFSCPLLDKVEALAKRVSRSRKHDFRLEAGYPFDDTSNPTPPTHEAYCSVHSAARKEGVAVGASPNRRPRRSPRTSQI